MTEDSKARAAETRRRNKEAQERRQAERREQERIDVPLILNAMRRVLESPDSSPDQLIFASAVLDSSQCYYTIPCRLDVPKATDTTRQTTEITKQLKEALDAAGGPGD